MRFPQRKQKNDILKIISYRHNKIKSFWISLFFSKVFLKVSFVCRTEHYSRKPISVSCFVSPLSWVSIISVRIRFNIDIHIWKAARAILQDFIVYFPTFSCRRTFFTYLLSFWILKRICCKYHHILERISFLWDFLFSIFCFIFMGVMKCMFFVRFWKMVAVWMGFVGVYPMCTFACFF